MATATAQEPIAACLSTPDLVAIDVVECPLCTSVVAAASRAANATATICGIEIETDETGRVLCPSVDFHVQYEYDEDFRRYFEEELEGLYLLDDELTGCEACERYVPDDDVIDVQTLPATHLSPSEWAPVCPACLSHDGEAV